MNPPRRSKRQLYLGILFVTLAFIVAGLRTWLGSAPSSEYQQLPDLIGLSSSEAIATLGQPTARMQFEPADESNPLRLQVMQRLESSPAGIPEMIHEYTWFSDDDTVTTIWFINTSPDPEITELHSIDSVRYKRQRDPSWLD